MHDAFYAYWSKIDLKKEKAFIMNNRNLIEDCSIVLIGRFNPAIFQPTWLREMGIEHDIPETDPNLLIFKNLANFTIGSHAYYVQTNRFQLTTTVAPWVSILDVAVKIFRENLPHTPVSAFGINRSVHFKLPSIAARTRLGRKSAPIEPWGKYGCEMNSGTSETVPGGLQSLPMRCNKIKNDLHIETNVTIEPSSRIDDNIGVYMHVNEHHEVTGQSPVRGSEQSIAILQNCFELAIEDADRIIDSMKNGGECS